MIAEPFSASALNQLIGQQHIPQGYYRSKLFIVPFTTNSLVAAAGPLLSLLERLCVTPYLPAIHRIRENIEHELFAFYSCLEGKKYTEELNIIAHYLLCATIDELLGKNYLRLYGEVAEFKAFTPPSQDNIGPEERFFDIVTYLKESPHQYLDVIELAYYCLITGFEGKQHGRADGRLVLDNLIEELFQLIKEHRVNKHYTLFKPPSSAIAQPKQYKLLITSSILAGVLLIGTYLLSHLILESKAKTLQLEHAVTAKLDYNE